MQISSFTRRPSGPLNSSHRPSSSSSPSAQNGSNHPYQAAAYGHGSHSGMSSESQGTSRHHADAIGGGSSGLGEFGTIGTSASPGPSLARPREGSGNTTSTSPHASPTVGGSHHTFPTGLADTAEQNLARSFTSATYGDMQPGLHSATNSTVGGGSTLVGTINSGHHSDSSMQESIARRIRALGYLKRCLSIANLPQASQNSNHGSLTVWLNTIKLSKRDIEVIYESEKMKRRTNRNYALGCSIAPTLEYSNSAEFARTLLNVFTDVEAMSEGVDRDKVKMKNFFKSSVRGTRRGSDWDHAAVLGGSSFSSGVDPVGGHVPFPLDYFQTTITLIDILAEMYHRFTFFLVNGKNAALSHNTGAKDVEAGLDFHHSGPAATTLEALNKIDGRVKKLMAQTCKELDALARHVIREELASIDPVMARELGLLEGSSSAHAGYDVVGLQSHE